MVSPIDQFWAQRAAKQEAQRKSLEEATKILQARRAEAARAADVRAQSAGDYVTPSGEIDRSMGRLGTYGSQAVRGFGSMIGSIPKGLADITQLATGYNPEGMRETGEDIESYFNQADVNPEYADTFGGKVAHGVGTTAGFFAGGAAGLGVKGLSAAAKTANAARALKAASYGTQYTMPVTAGINEITEDFRRTTGRDPSREELATLVPSGAGLGAMEMLPVGRALGRLPGAGVLTEEAKRAAYREGGKKGIKSAMRWDIGKRIGKGTLEEFVQEGTQQISQNVIAKNIAAYDKDREVFEGLAEAASVGGASGFIVNSALMLAGAKLRGSRTNLENDTLAKEEDQKEVEQQTEDLRKQTKEKILADDKTLQEKKQAFVDKRLELVRARESEATNPEEVAELEKEARELALDYAKTRRDFGVTAIDVAAPEGAEEALPEEAFGEVTEEIELGDEKLGQAQLEQDALLREQAEMERVAAEDADRRALDEAAAGIEVTEDGLNAEQYLLDRAAAGTVVEELSDSEANYELIYQGRRGLPSPTNMGEAPIPLEEWNEGPLPGEYPGRNYVRPMEAQVTKKAQIPPTVVEAMKADTQEAIEQAKEAEAKAPKRRKQATKGKEGATPQRKAALPPVPPKSVAAKRGRAAKNAVAKVATAATRAKAAAPVVEQTGSPALDKIRQDISDWADKKGMMSAKEYNANLKTLKNTMRKQLLAERPIIEGERKGTAQREVNKIINKYVKTVTPTKEITEANKAEAEALAPTTVESFIEEVSKIEGASVNEDGSITIPVPMEGTVEGPAQMQELFQQEHLAGLRAAFSARSTQTVNRKEADVAYSDAFQKYVMSRIKQPRTAPAHLLAAEARMETRDAIELLSNEGILPPEFTTVSTDVIADSIVEEYVAGDPVVANLVTALDAMYPINEKTKKRSMKAGPFPINLNQKEALNEALLQTGLYIRAYNMSDGTASLVNTNSHVKDKSPTEVLGSAAESITLTRDTMESLVTPEEVTAPPPKETPLYNEKEAAKVAPVTGMQERIVPPAAGKASLPSIGGTPAAVSSEQSPEGQELYVLANLSDDYIAALKGPDVTAILKKHGFTADEIPHKIVDRKELLRNAVGEAQDMIGGAPVEQTGEVREDEYGEYTLVPRKRGGADDRLAAALQSIPEITKEEAGKAKLDPKTDPRNLSFSDEGAAPRTESGEIELDANEESLTALEHKLYSGEKLTKDEQIRLDKDLLNDLIESDDYVIASREKDDVYQTISPSNPAKTIEAYTPSGAAMRKALQLAKQKAGKPAKLRDILNTLFDTLPYKSADRALVKILMGLNLDTTIEIVDSLSTREGKAVGGEYHKKDQHIKISEQGLDSDIAYITLHEAVHAATIHAYDADPEFQQRIEAIYEAALVAYYDNGGSIDGVDYAMTSPTEFLAEIFTNPMVMKFANDVYYPSVKHGKLRNLFEAFLDSIREWFGIGVKERSVLKRALVVGYRGFRDQLQINEIVDEELDVLHNMDPFYDDVRAYAPPARPSEAPNRTASQRIADSLEDFSDIQDATASTDKPRRPFGASWMDRYNTQDLMEATAELDQSDIDAAHGLAARAGNWINRVQESKYFNKYRMLGGLIDKKSYMTARGQSMGLASQMDELANYFGERFSKVSEESQIALIDYFTNKDAPIEEVPQELQADAVWAKEEIMRQAIALEELGYLDPAVNEETLGEYLPNVYLLWMLDPSGDGKVNSTGGAGAKTSLQHYLMQRKKMDAATKELFGIIEDPALLTARTIATVGRDIAVLDFLKNINDFAKKQGSKPWVFPGSDKIVTYEYFNEDGERMTDQKDTIPVALANMEQFKQRMIDKGFKDESKRAVHKNFYEVQMNKINDALYDLYEENQKKGVAAVDPKTLNINEYTWVTDGKRNGALANQWIRNEIYDDIRANTFAFSTGETSTAEKLLGQDSILTKGNRFWKATKTIYNIPAHGRNFVSNFINWDISTDTSTSEVSKILWNTAGDWIKARKRGDKYPNTRVWQLADKFGITETTWTAQEAIRFQKDWEKLNRRGKMDDWLDKLPEGLPMREYIKEYLPHMTGKGIRMMTFLGEAYQGNETLFKVAKLQDELNKMAKQYPDAAANPQSTEWLALEAAAVQEAQRMIFDYSNVTKSVKYLRNAPIGAPFLSFSYLAAPRIIENTVKHPVKMMKYISMPYLFGELAASLGVFDDDDWETAKNKAPNFLKDKHTLLPMPWKDENGDPIVWDLAYYLPYAPFLETAHQYKNILSGNDTETGLHSPVLRNFGILSGPVPDILAAMKTNIDPFTQQEIVDPRGSAGQKAADAFMYAWSVAMPTFLSHHGLAGNIYKQITKKDLINPRTLEERTSPTEAVLRGLGVSVYSYDPADSRGVNARYYRSLLQKQKIADRKKINKMYTEGASFEKIAKERRNAAERQQIYRSNYENYIKGTQ
jgi:hypothetical protein